MKIQLQHASYIKGTHTVVFDRYGNGRTAIFLYDHEGPVTDVTKNLPEYALPEGYVLIKDYAENEGILPDLVEAGLIGPVERQIPSGHIMLKQCKLLHRPIAA